MAKKKKKSFKKILSLCAVIIAAVFYLFPEAKHYPVYVWYELDELLFASSRNYDNLNDGTPAGHDLRIINREGYAFGYSAQHKQSLWVTWLLTKEEVLNKHVARTDDFRRDPRILFGSQLPEDYKRSGYDRGHLAPAADMGWDKTVMSESFYMSNMIPQTPELNRGRWLDLENVERALAEQYGSLRIIAGPVFRKNDTIKTIGDNQISVPHDCYKIFFVPEKKIMIAFIMPNEKPQKKLVKYAVSVDEIEQLTGLDFFPHLPEEEQKRMESNCDPDVWNLQNICETLQKNP